LIAVAIGIVDLVDRTPVGLSENQIRHRLAHLSSMQHSADGAAADSRLYAACAT
jgi:hypothetical protein